MEEHEDVARRVGSVASEARQKLEAEIGKSIVSSLNAKAIHKSIEDEKE